MISKELWTRFWARRSGISPLGRFSARLATWFVPPYHGRTSLARYSKRGFVSPTASIYHSQLRLGAHSFIGDDVIIYEDRQGGSVKLGDKIHLQKGVILQTGQDGKIEIGDGTHVQPFCQFSAYKRSIRIGRNVEMAPRCAFYPYNHATSSGLPIREQPLTSKGDIIVGDDAWLGYGVVVLDGVTIGHGSVVGAGSLVTRDIPANAIAVGSPAKVVKYRQDN